MTRINTSDLATAARFMGEAAEAAAVIAKRYFRSQIQVDDKEDKSPVTVADRDIEAMLRARIIAEFPEHGIYGEEEAPYNLGADMTWVVDPIDGTKSFVTGHPLFGSLLALLDAGEPCLGQIDMPLLGERWQGQRGQPSLFNGQACQTRDCKTLSAAYLYTTNPYAFPGESQIAFDAVAAQVRLTRYGGDCYNYGLLASGHCDLVIETGLQPFDYLALVQVIRGAGGMISDWSGAELTLQSAGDVVASATPELHAEALALLSGHAPTVAG